MTRRSPPLGPTPRERELIARLATPTLVQRWLNDLPYNAERGGETLRSFRGVVRHGTAHCLEAALFAAVVLECHGFPPTVLSFESRDLLDHVIFVYRHRGRWGAIGRSRDPGLHGRKPVFPTLRALARSYVEPYVDDSGRILAYGLADLGEALAGYDWRWSARNVWKVERLLIDWPHVRLPTSDARYRELRRRYRAFRAAYPERKPLYYDRTAWTAIPREFR